MLLIYLIDIIDITWSPNDHFIASASLDNTVKIWNISSEACKKVNVNTPFKELKGHSGWVMGISWDTLGRVYYTIYIYNIVYC